MSSHSDNEHLATGTTNYGKREHTITSTASLPEDTTFSRSAVTAGPAPPADHEADFVTRNEDEDLSRGLHQRHVSLIAIAGGMLLTSLVHVCTTEDG